MWKTITFYILKTFLILCFYSSCSDPQDTDKKPNILYICLEDLSPRLGCYGDTIVKSPNIDRFAEESVLFGDVHCQVALCTPSRTSILTGIRPSTSGIVRIDDNWKEILPNTTSLPRHFRDHGYFTYRVGKISDPRSGGPDEAWVYSEEDWGVETNDLPIKAIDSVFNQEKPFFLAIGYKQTHDPWDPSQRALDMYDWENINIHGPGRSFKNENITNEKARELAQRYYADITDVDSLVGDLLSKIKSTSFYENTIILVGAMDHGYSLGYHNKWGKSGLYDTQTQVPFLMRIPGNEKSNGKKASGLIELVDIYPTLIELCDLPKPPQILEGYSFVRLLNEPEREWKRAVFTHQAYNLNAIGMKTKEYNLIMNGEKIELYDRIIDPYNLNDISEENPDIVGELGSLLQLGWQNALPD